MAEVFVQTRIPVPLAKWVAQQATGEGVSVAAWLRRLIMQAQAQLRTDAWLDEIGGTLTPHQAFHEAPHFLLEHARDISPTCAAYWVLRGGTDRDPSKGTPIPERELRKTALKDPEKCRFLLFPDQSWWRVVRLVEDAPSARVQVILQRE